MSQSELTGCNGRCVASVSLYEASCPQHGAAQLKQALQQSAQAVADQLAAEFGCSAEVSFLDADGTVIEKGKSGG